MRGESCFDSDCLGRAGMACAVFWQLEATKQRKWLYWGDGVAKSLA